MVIQEINRAYDQPSTVAEYLIDRAAFGDHPLGRTVLGPEENLRSFTREGIVAFRERRWSGTHGGAFLAGNLEHVPDDAELHERFARFPVAARARAVSAGAGVRAGEAGRRARHQPVAPAHDLPPEITVSDVRERAALSIYSTLLGGSMGSRLFEEIREKRGPVLLGVRAQPRVRGRADPAARARAWSRRSAIEAYTRMREIVDELRSDGPTEEEVQRARAYAAGRLVLAFENTNAVARYAANQQIVFGEDIDPDAAIAALDAVTFDEVREVAAGVADNLAVACVGPHSAEEF